MKSFVWDIEATGLLDEKGIDYSASPFALRDSWKMLCIVVILDDGTIYAFYDGETLPLDGRRYEVDVGGYQSVLDHYEEIVYRHFQLKDFPRFVRSLKKQEGVRIIAHNQINFDLLACKLYYGLDYTIAEDDAEKDTWAGANVVFDDTYIRSKTLFPDRRGGHSLDALSENAGIRKVAFRKHIPEDVRFTVFGADMLYYNIYDCKANADVATMLDKEQGDWNWDSAIRLEKSVANIITQQSHRGFCFDMSLAEKCIADLDAKMEERRLKVEPVLPPKRATQAVMKEYTPPKNQFKKDGTLSSHMLRFLEKHDGVYHEEENTVELFGKTFPLPLEQVPLVTTTAATIQDTTHIKEWLVGLGWTPSEYKEKDLSVDTKKQKLSPEKYEAVVNRYVEQTINSNFCKDRCEKLDTSPERLKQTLLKMYSKGRSVKVITNPSFTVGLEKEIDPALSAMGEEFPYAKDVVEYLTFRHRRNSILGGGLEWDDEGEADKGYLAAVREDGRIPTPADTCGAATSRMKHRLVANIPRVTSLYGHEMRALFGVDNTCFQLGYDFDSLEARMESHYTWKYDSEEGKPYCNALLSEKPHDVHTMTAEKITKILGRKFDRAPAKSVKYGCVPVDNTEVLTRDGWKCRNELSVGDDVLSYSMDKNAYEYAKIEKLWDYKDADVITLSNKRFSVEVTEDHEWINGQRYTIQLNGEEHPAFVTEKRATSELDAASNIIASARSFVSPTLSVVEGKVLGKLLSENFKSENKSGTDWVRVIANQDYMVLSAFLCSFFLGAGKGERSKVIRLEKGNISDAVALAINMTGNVCYGKVQKDGMLTLSIKNGQTISGQRLKQAPSRTTDVFCLSNKNNSFVMRQNGFITLTGNCTYGASPEKVAKIIGSDARTGEIVYDAFWKAAAPLASLKEHLTRFWETKGGKKFVVAIDGRKIYTRSPHAILNSLFQSAGVICAKRAMVLHAQKLKQAGYWVDFFTEDWKNRSFAQQLIAYHDEAQLEVSRSLVKFKKFATEEEAKAFKEAQTEVWSDIKESPKGGYYIAYSKVGELASEAVKEAGEFYHLNVELTAGYIIGRNWADCH